MSVVPQATVTLAPPQTEPPCSPRETLPSMYDLPSEDPEEPGLPDEFHDSQPQLLRETFRPRHHTPEQIFIGTDLNLYYDTRHPLWHKRPDWFAVLGVSRLYNGHDLRLSYVMWQEGVAPYLVVELLSPSTEQEDLGTAPHLPDTPPSKWTVYEQVVRIPYYVLFSRYTNTARYFVLDGCRYREVRAAGQGLWLPEAELGIGVWFGLHDGLERHWLRFYDAQGHWLPTPLEEQRQRANMEQQRADAAQQRAETAEAELAQLRARLAQLERPHSMP